MTNQHPITPPPELVQQWDEECESGNNSEVSNTFDALQWFASKAAQWGANQELDACCAWLLEEPLCASNTHRKLRAARRKPPSLKEQALQALSEAVKMADDVPPEGICSGQADIIRRALEQLSE
jgi:hypothetical protein